MRKIERIISSLKLESAIAAAPKAIRDPISRRRYGDAIESLEKLRHTVTDDNYSLKGFDEYNCIFVHVPKCAGVSVTNALFGNHAGGHIPLCRYLALYGAKRFDEMFKFTFVRNPWDRIASAYFFLQSGGMTQTDAEWGKRWLASCASLDDFVQNLLPDPEVREMVHFRTQMSFLVDPRTDEIGCDFVGRYESLAADFEHIAGKLGRDVSLPNLNKTKGGVKRRWDEEMSPQSMAIIRELYARDVDDLGYQESVAPCSADSC